MCIKSELESIERLSNGFIINAIKLVYPESKSLLSLESYLLGSSIIGTESIISKIKERTEKIEHKSWAGVSKLKTILNENKWWVAGGLTIVAAFAAASLALLKNNKSPDAIKGLKSKIHDLADKARAKIKELKEKGGKPEPTNQSVISKIWSIVKNLLDVVKRGKEAVPEVAKKLANKKKGSQPSQEGAVWDFIKSEPILMTVYAVLFPVVIPPVIIILIIELVSYCKSKNKEQTVSDKKEDESKPTLSEVNKLKKDFGDIEYELSEFFHWHYVTPVDVENEEDADLLDNDTRVKTQATPSLAAKVTKLLRSLENKAKSIKTTTDIKPFYKNAKDELDFLLHIKKHAEKEKTVIVTMYKFETYTEKLETVYKKILGGLIKRLSDIEPH